MPQVAITLTGGVQEEEVTITGQDPIQHTHDLTELFTTVLFTSLDSAEWVLRSILPAFDEIVAGFLDWEKGVAVVHLAVDRSREASRRAAYNVELQLSQALPGLEVVFRLLDQSEVTAAELAGSKVIYRA